MATVKKIEIQSEDGTEIYHPKTSTDNVYNAAGKNIDTLLSEMSSQGGYTHPATHPASMITQDTTHRFVSDTEKNTWNNKVDRSGDTMTGTLTVPAIKIGGATMTYDSASSAIKISFV